MVAAVAGLAISAYGAYSSSQAGKKGANAQARANDASIAEQRRQYDQTREDQLPFLQAGYGALDRQEAYLNGDWSGFYNSPDYKFAVDQGFQGLNRGLAAQGGAGPGGFSGGADADRIALGQGLATQYANNYWNKLAGQAGQGQQSARDLGGLGMGMANSIGNLNSATANARASAYANSANQWNNFGQQLSGYLGGQYGRRG